MAKLTLCHATPSRSSIVRWMLEELGQPYDLHVLTLLKGEQRQADYLEINPMGKVPALKHGDVIVTEAAAISPMSSQAPNSMFPLGIRNVVRI